MTPQSSATPRPTLAEVKEQFKNWRRTRQSPYPIPQHLLEAAKRLSGKYSIQQICDELIIDREDLRKKPSVNKKDGKKPWPATFIELDCEAPAPMSECVVEMEDGSGAKMRMHFRGKMDFDLLELGKAFLGKRP